METASTTKTMKFRQSLFWDVNPQKIDVKKNARYIIERILDIGRDKEVRWLWNFYDKALLKNTVRTSKNLRPETKTLWELILKNY
jgi:hypothetical protein